MDAKLDQERYKERRVPTKQFTMLADQCKFSDYNQEYLILCATSIII